METGAGQPGDYMMCVEDFEVGQEAARGLHEGPRAFGGRLETPLHAKLWRVNSLLKTRGLLHKGVTISDLPLETSLFFHVPFWAAYAFENKMNA